MTKVKRKDCKICKGTGNMPIVAQIMGSDKDCFNCK